MSRDITRILEGWDFDPRQVSVRLIQGENGKEKIQMRIDLGLMQMEIDGRPDGLRPGGHESWLDFYRAEQKSHAASNPDGPAFQLKNEDCQRLMIEGMQYYHRYLSFWHLQKYELCARDTNRNLRLFQFVREHAQDDEDKLRFDRWRPHVTLMHTRAVATPLVELRDYETAVKVIEAGIRGIRRFLEDYDQTERAADTAELVELERWRESILERWTPPLPPPLDPIKDLEARLAQAIDHEQYEQAAQLRDEIRRLSRGGLAPDGGERP